MRTIITFDYYNTLIILCQMSIIIHMMHKKISMKIKIERIKRNLTQEQLAELADLDRSTVSKIERNIISPTIVTLEKIANAFNMTIIDLINVEKIEL